MNTNNEQSTGIYTGSTGIFTAGRKSQREVDDYFSKQVQGINIKDLSDAAFAHAAQHSEVTAQRQSDADKTINLYEQLPGDSGWLNSSQNNDQTPDSPEGLESVPTVYHEPTYDERQQGAAVTRAEESPSRTDRGEHMSQQPELSDMDAQKDIQAIEHYVAVSHAMHYSGLPAHDDRTNEKLKQSWIGRGMHLLLGSAKKNEKRPISVRECIEAENKIGAQLFGPYPADKHRDFFVFDGTTVVWREEGRDLDNKPYSTMIRYEIQQGGILKVISEHGKVVKYTYLDDRHELHNLATAMQMYYECCMEEVYGLDPATAQPLETASPATM